MFQGNYWHTSYWGARYWRPVQFFEVAESGATAKKAKKVPQDDLDLQEPIPVALDPPKSQDFVAHRAAEEVIKAASEAQKAAIETAQKVIASHQADLAAKEAVRLAEKRRDEQAAILLLLT